MAKPIRVGIVIEPESAHKDNYLMALAEIDEVGSVAVADRTGKMVERARQLLKAKLDAGTFQDSREMFAKALPQLALVTLPADVSPPVIDAALQAGCHVLAEKPACVRAEDFEPLVTRAEKPIGIPYRAANVLSTLYAHLGIDAACATLPNFSGRPVYLLDDPRKITELE